MIISPLEPFFSSHLLLQLPIQYHQQLIFQQQQYEEMKKWNSMEEVPEADRWMRKTRTNHKSQSYWSSLPQAHRPGVSITLSFINNNNIYFQQTNYQIINIHLISKILLFSPGFCCLYQCLIYIRWWGL